MTLPQKSFAIDLDAIQLLIPPEARKEFGQIYTPPDIAQFMAQLVLDSREGIPVVLDPASGCGILLRMVKEEIHNIHTQLSPSALLKRLWGVELNPMAVQVSKQVLQK